MIISCQGLTTGGYEFDRIVNVGQPDGLAQIPDKTYFKIGEVCEITGVKSHTLRYWESEFTVIRPQRAGSQQRLYRKVDIENILLIKGLIYERGMTLAGVRKILARNKKEVPVAVTAPYPSRAILQEIKEELASIKKILS